MPEVNRHNSANLEASASSLQEYPYQNVMFFDKCLANYLMNRLTGNIKNASRHKGIVKGIIPHSRGFEVVR